jgi:hypothetical protein
MELYLDILCGVGDIRRLERLNLVSRRIRL